LKGNNVKNQLTILVAEMYDGGILYSEAVREFKKSFLSHVLQQNRGNQSKAAKQLGMHRNTLSRTLTELDLDVRQLRRTQSPTPTQSQSQSQSQSKDAGSGKDGRRPPRSAASLQSEKKAAR
jgi:Fis family transcriptional regulator, factor for inversion stimulation protein